MDQKNSMSRPNANTCWVVNLGILKSPLVQNSMSGPVAMTLARGAVLHQGIVEHRGVAALAPLFFMDGLSE